MGLVAAPASRMYINALDISCDLTEMDTDMSTDTQDSTTFCTAVGRTAAAVLQSAVFSLKGLASSDITAGIGNLLSPLFGTSVLATAWPAGDAAGRIGWGSPTAILNKWKPSAKVGQLVAVSGELVANDATGGVEMLTSVEPKQQVTGTGSAVQTTRIDNGAASTAGGAAFFQVFAADASPGISSLILRHSSDDSTYTTLATSTLTGVGAERVPIAGTINRYVKRSLTNTSGKHVTLQTALNRQ